MNRFTWIVGAAMMLLLIAAPSTALARATIHVDDDAPDDPGPGDPSISDPLEDGSAAHPFDAIQEAIDAAVNGDTVLAADGLYRGEGNRDIDFLGKAITVCSMNGAGDCVIDCEGFLLAPHRGFIFVSGEGPGSVLRGVTVINAAGHACGGAVFIEEASPVLEALIITGNSASAGGGIYGNGGSPIILSCEILLNEADGLLANEYGCYDQGGGGGVSICTTGSVTIDGCRIEANVAAYCGGGIYVEHHDLATITDTVIAGNEVMNGWGGGGKTFSFANLQMNNVMVRDNIAPGGGGLQMNFIYDSSALLASCTIAGNVATDWYGGGIARSDFTPLHISNSIIYGNVPDQLDGLYIHVTHSDVEGGAPSSGPGNIDADPLFVSGPDGDYYLSQVDAGQEADSPCVDAGPDLAASSCWQTPGGSVCLGSLTTRTDGINDQGVADMGYHYPALDPMSAWLSCEPSSGTLPFSTTIALGLVNNLDGDYRQVAGHLDVVLGNGTAFPNWRAGHLVLAPGESHAISWNQLIPEILPAYGDNRFTLVAADVTPAPWNQPPYPPSGSTDWAQCTVTGEYR